MGDPWRVIKMDDGKKYLQHGFFTDEDAVFLPEADVAALILFLQTCGETWRRGDIQEEPKFDPPFRQGWVNPVTGHVEVR